MTETNPQICSPENSEQDRPNTWLNQFACNITSQYGEDGIIEKVLEIVPDHNNWCVEFGSWDGKNCSNTYTLIDKKNYSAILIEANPKRYKDLLKTFEGNRKIIPLNEFVGFEKSDCLDRLLEKFEIPEDFDILSVDIDGNDYHVWEAVQDYKPKVVVIEFNPTIPPNVEFIQPRDPHVTQGSSLLSITKLGKSKGYELVAATTTNAIFVDSKYFDLFGISDNSPQAMMVDESFITQIFCGYDGTVFLAGCQMLPWQTIPYEQSRVQQLPKWARKRVGDRNFIRRKLGRKFRKLRSKGVI